MKMTKKLADLLLACGVLFAHSLYAQPTAPIATQQAQNFQQNMEMQKPLLSLRPGTNAPALYPGENTDVGEQRILRLIPRQTHFEVTLDSQYLYTDNALLTQHPYVSSTEFVNTLVAAYSPTPYRIGPGRFAPQMGYRGQWFDYGLGGNSKMTGGAPIDSIDFNVQSAFAGGKYLFPNNWIAFGELDYNWFLSQQNSSMFYREFVPTFGLERLIQVGNDAVLAISAQGDWHDSWQINPPHGLQDRGDGIVSVSLAFQITRQLVMQPYYRFQYTYYPVDTLQGGARHDFLNSFGFSVAWYFTPSLSLRAFMNEDANAIMSDSHAPQYHDLNVGANLSWALRF